MEQGLLWGQAFGTPQILCTADFLRDSGTPFLKCQNVEERSAENLRLVHQKPVHKNLRTNHRKRAEYGFGEYGFKHRAQWVFRGSLSFGERTQWVPLGLYFVCKHELTKFVAELTEFAAELSEAQWVLFSETVLSKQYSARFLNQHTKISTKIVATIGMKFPPLWKMIWFKLMIYIPFYTVFYSIKSRKKKQHKHKLFGPDFPRTFLTLTPECPGAKKFLPTTGAAGKRTFWCGCPLFSARTSMTRRVVEKLCTKKSLRWFFVPYKMKIWWSNLMIDTFNLMIYMG